MLGGFGARAQARGYRGAAVVQKEEKTNGKEKQNIEEKKRKRRKKRKRKTKHRRKNGNAVKTKKNKESSDINILIDLRTIEI